MKQIHNVFLLLVAILIGTLTITACSTPGATVAPAAATTPTSSSLAQATLTTQPTSTSPPTSTTVPTPAATRTTAPVVPITVATVVAPGMGEATGNAAGVFATAIRVSPAQPVVSAEYATFHVTFNNTTGKTQQLKWYVKIWTPASSTQSFGETAKQINDIPPGVSEVASAANWRTNPINCEAFTARVYWLHQDVNFGNPNEFKKPDGSAGPQLNFQVCEKTRTP